jgi:hypothetical protein
MQLAPVSGGGETVLHEPLGLGVSFEGGVAPVKSFKDAAWALKGTLTLLEGGETVELSDAACLGEGVPQPEQDEEGKWLLTLTPASPGVLSLTLTLTGPKNFSLEAALQHSILPLPTPQELLEAVVAAGDEAALSKMLGENAEAEWSWETAAGVPLLAVLCTAPVDEEVRLQLLAMLLGAGAVVPPRPLQRSAPPSALHLAIYSGEGRMLDALLARASAEELAAQACPAYYGHTYYGYTCCGGGTGGARRASPHRR